MFYVTVSGLLFLKLLVSFCTSTEPGKIFHQPYTSKYLVETSFGHPIPLYKISISQAKYFTDVLVAFPYYTNAFSDFTLSLNVITIKLSILFDSSLAP